LDILVPEGTVSLFFFATKKREPLIAGANKHILKAGAKFNKLSSFWPKNKSAC
jgi:hypothetical protein